MSENCGSSKVLMKGRVPVGPYIGVIGKSFGTNTGIVYFRIIDDIIQANMCMKYPGAYCIRTVAFVVVCFVRT